MQRCWERSRHEVRIRELCTSPMSLNTCIFLEMLAEGGSQARTGAEQRLPPHRLSNTYGFPCTVAKSDNLCASGFSMVTQPHSPSIILTLRGKGFFFFPSRSKFILKSSTFLPGSHGHGTCSCAFPLPRRTRWSQPAHPRGPVHSRGDIPGDVPTGSCCRATHHGPHGAGPPPAFPVSTHASSQAKPLVRALPHH